MQTVVFCEYQSGDREYLQPETSKGLGHNYYDEIAHWGKLYGLDSRVAVFPNVKAAQEVIERYLSPLVSTRKKHDAIAKVGYHGITENGNACPPFRTIVKDERRLVRFNPFDAKCLPPTVSDASPVAVPRLGNLSIETVRRELAYLTDNMVEEELLHVELALKPINRHWLYRFTDIDKYEDQAILHYNRGFGGHAKAFSIVITAFNLTKGDE